MFQWLQFKMLKKFVLYSVFVVKQLLQCYLIESDFIEMGRGFDVCFIMSLNAVEIVLTGHFWSAVGFFVD